MKIKFTNDVSIEDSLVFEKVYPENLQWNLESKQELKDDGTEFLYMVDGDTGELIGEAYFLPLDTMEDWDADEEQTEDGLGPWYGKNCIYPFSTTILEKFQGKGFGKLLKSYCLGLWKARGYDYAVGHARDGASIGLQQYFGAEVIGSFPNWYQTGECYSLYLQKL
jgi:GNAT superfamily N-acetyltransferase